MRDLHLRITRHDSTFSDVAGAVARGHVASKAGEKQQYLKDALLQVADSQTMALSAALCFERTLPFISEVGPHLDTVLLPARRLPDANGPEHSL